MSDDYGREPWQDQPPITRAVFDLAGEAISFGAGAFGYSARMTGKAETLLDEYIGFLQDARPLVSALSKAVDSGLIDDARRVLRLVEAGVTQISAAAEQLDRATTQLGKLVPNVDRAARGFKKIMPVIETMPETQEDIREARAAAARLENLIQLTLDQVGTLPGASLVRGLGRSLRPPEDS